MSFLAERIGLNSQEPYELEITSFCSFIILGFAQMIGSVALLLTYVDGNLTVKNLANNSEFSNPDLVFTIVNNKIRITSTSSSSSTLTIFKGLS